MKELVIAIVIGAVGYYVFFYEPTDTVTEQERTKIEQQQQYEQGILDEVDVERKTYGGALTDTYDSIKSTIESAKDSVKKIEDKSQAEY